MSKTYWFRKCQVICGGGSLVVKRILFCLIDLIFINNVSNTLAILRRHCYSVRVVGKAVSSAFYLIMLFVYQYHHQSLHFAIRPLGTTQ